LAGDVVDCGDAGADDSTRRRRPEPGGGLSRRVTDPMSIDGGVTLSFMRLVT
jgi:hypothetical protein